MKRLLFSERFLVSGRRPLDISLFGFSKMDFESFLGKINTHILKVLLDKIMNRLKGLVGVDLCLFLSLILFDEEGRKNLLDPRVTADRAVDYPGRSLLFVRSVVFEPTLKDVAVAAHEIKSNHDLPLTY